MHEWQSLSHVRWDCKYHVVIIPKYRRKVFYGRLRRQIGTILRDLCRQRGVELLEGHAMPDHIHLCLSVPPEVQCGVRPRLPEGEERRADPSGVAARASDEWPEFLGAGLLREHRRAG